MYKFCSDDLKKSLDHGREFEKKKKEDDIAKDQDKFEKYKKELEESGK